MSNVLQPTTPSPHKRATDAIDSAFIDKKPAIKRRKIEAAAVGGLMRETTAEHAKEPAIVEAEAPGVDKATVAPGTRANTEQGQLEFEAFFG